MTLEFCSGVQTGILSILLHRLLKVSKIQTLPEDLLLPVGTSEG